MIRKCILLMGLLMVTHTAHAQTETGSPRVSGNDMHLILLSRVYKQWSDEDLIAHTIRPVPHMDEFQKRDLLQLRAPQIKEAIGNWEGTDSLRLAAINIEVPKQSLESLVGLPGPKLPPFSMPGFRRDDMFMPMTLGKFDLNSSSFLLEGYGLPCGELEAVGGFGNYGKRVLEWKPKKWKTLTSANLTQRSPWKQDDCVIHVPDEKLARAIESARHGGNLAIGVIMHGRLPEKDIDGVTEVEVDRLDVSFFKKVSGNFMKIGDAFALYPSAK